MDQLKAASIIEKQALKSLSYKTVNFLNHPIRLIQASKSLIGLNLDTPNEKLLKFNSSVLANNTYESIKFKNFKNDNIKEVISTHNLEDAFIKNDKDEVLNELYQLSKVSSSLHILEYLVEISLKQTGKSFLIIWSIYRTIFFINQKDIKFFLDLSIDAIFSDKFSLSDLELLPINDNIIKNSNLSITNIDLFSHLLEAYNSNLVRSDKIKILISNVINKRFPCRKDDSSVEFNFKYPQLLKTGRSWLLEFIDDIDNNITIELILFLDSIRCLFKFLNKKDYKFICAHFERLIKVFNV
jgi:hypothetical protein